MKQYKTCEIIYPLSIALRHTEVQWNVRVS